MLSDILRHKDRWLALDPTNTIAGEGSADSSAGDAMVMWKKNTVHNFFHWIAAQTGGIFFFNPLSGIV